MSTLQNDMRILSTVIALSVWGSASVAFTIPSWFNAPQNHVRNRLATNKHAVKISNASFVLSVRRYDGDVHDTVKESIARALAAVIVSAAMWTTPISIAGPPGYSFSGLDPSQQENHVISGMVANAKEMASGSGSRVNKNPQSLLRYGLPVNNKEVRASKSLNYVGRNGTPPSTHKFRVDC